jgi:WD40 repeat protein
MANLEILHTPCPDRADLERLLNESEADSVQSHWKAHLETCAVCQQTLQSLVASEESWIAMARHLGPKELVAPALGNVMVALKDGGSLSGIGSGQDRPLLDFLDLAEWPDQLGRLAHYDVSEVIGRGGMGVVLKAWDSALHRVVAIKVLAPRLAVNPAAQARFVREARAVAAISHENVVAVHAVGETHGLPYLVMQHISGVSLQERLSRKEPLSVLEIVRIGMQTAAGLAAAHAQGLIHCDIKPDNLLLEAGSGRVKITDFGLARALDEAGNTATETIAGTPRFMAPEQARGETLDPRTDLFSLGSVLYTLCTGEFPFQGRTNAEVLHQVVNQTPVPIARLQPRIPSSLIEVINRLHAKDRGQRFTSAAEVVTALEQVLANPSDRWAFIPTENGPLSAPGKSRRHSLRTVAAVLLLLGGLIATEITGITHLAATVFRIRTPQGILVVEVDDPQTRVTLDKEELVISNPGSHEFRLRPGEYLLRATRDGQTTQQEIVTITRGEKKTVTIRLEPAVASRVETNDSFGVVARLVGHQGPVRMLAISRDGKWLLSCSGWPQGDRTIRLWDLASGKEVRRLGRHEDQVYAVAFSPDATSAVSGGEDGAVRVWDVKTGELTRQHLDSKMPIHSVAFSPDGKTVVAGGGDRKIRHWSVESGKLLRSFTGHTDAVASVTFSGDGKRLASGGRDKTMRVWDVETAGEVILDKHVGWVTAVQFSPDGDSIAWGSVSIRISNARTGKLIRELKGHKWGTNALAFSADGRRILSGGYDTTVRLWDAASGQQLHNFADHREWVWSVAFTPDGKQALSAGGGGQQNSEYVRGTDFAIRVWKLPP